MASSNVTLVSKDGQHEITFDQATDAVEITNYRAAGWATKAEQKAAAKPESKGEAAK